MELTHVQMNDIRDYIAQKHLPMRPPLYFCLSCLTMEWKRNLRACRFLTVLMFFFKPQSICFVLNWSLFLMFLDLWLAVCCLGCVTFEDWHQTLWGQVLKLYRQCLYVLRFFLAWRQMPKCQLASGNFPDAMHVVFGIPQDSRFIILDLSFQIKTSWTF